MRETMHDSTERWAAGMIRAIPGIAAPVCAIPVAIASLICGILGWVAAPIVASLLAVALGHYARHAIRTSSDQRRAYAIATVGLVLGYTQLCVIVMLVGMTRLPMQAPW